MQPILEKIVQQVSTHVPAKEQEMFQKWSLAGPKIMFDPKFHQNMELVKNPESRKDPVRTIAKGVTGLVWVMYGQAGRPQLSDELTQVMGFTATILMCHAIDFAEQSLGIQFTPQMISDCTKWLIQHLFEQAGITQEQLQNAINEKSKQLASGQPQQESDQVAQPSQPPQQGGILAGGQ